MLAATLLVLGVMPAWSWVGLLGLAAVAVAFVALRHGWEAALLTLPAWLAMAVAAWWSVARGAWVAPSLSRLGEVLSSRTRIFAQGLELATQRPWGGWGPLMSDLSSLLGAVGRYHVDDLALPHFHSLYVQTLFETSVPSLMTLAAWFG